MKVFLIGFMGSGKSYIGARLAQKLDMPFFDLDALIEEKAQKSIRAIFDEEGETEFRKLERNTLLETARHEQAVIACGGGTPCFFDNIAWMNRNGLTIYLETSWKILFLRLSNQQEQRPLLKDLGAKELKKYIRSKLAERETCYRRASVIYQQRSGREPVVEDLTVHFKDIIGPA